MSKIKYRIAPAGCVQVESVRFRRTSDALWEYGIMLGHDIIIIDRQFKLVDYQDMWDYQRITDNGLALFHFPEHKEDDITG
jgi:hypothetical protein